MEPVKRVRGSVPSSAQELGTRITAVADLYRDRKSAASAAGISTDQLSRYMRGENQPPFLVAVNMASRVNVSVHWLATGEGPMLVDRDAGKPACSVNLQLLRAAIEAVESFLNGDKAPADKKAKLVVALYKYGEGKGMMQKGELTDFLRLVA